MLTVICGEDTIASRDYYIKLKEDFRRKGYEATIVPSGRISDIPLWLSSSPTLFATKSVFFTEHLNKKLGRTTVELKKILEIIAKDPSIDLVTWEDASLRELKTGKTASVKEFKPQATIFKLLDLCLPSKKKEFLALLPILMADYDPTFIYLMIVRQARKLLLARDNIFEGNVASWQKGKLTSQAHAWSAERLLSFYDALFRIDVGLKTGNTPYTLKQSLDILAVHFL